MATVDPNWAVPSVTSSTNLGPLTTSLSFPANCFNNLYDFQTYGLGAPYTYETQGCALSTCCPSNKFYTAGWGWFSTYYSPGVCPSNYKSCAPYTGLVTKAEETPIFCCPQNYGCPSNSAGNGYYACGSLLSTPTPITVLDDIFDQNIVSTRTFSLVSSLEASYQIAYPIQIRYKASELLSSGTVTWINPAALSMTESTANPTTMASSSLISPSLPSATPTSTSSSLQTSHSLSASAKIGLGVGLGVGLVLLILVFFIGLRLCVRRRRAAAREQAHVPPPAITEQFGHQQREMSEIEGHQVHIPRQELETPTAAFPDISRLNRMGELPGS